MCQIKESRKGRLNSLYRRELLKVDIALRGQNFDSVGLHLKRASKLLKAMDFDFMKGN
ncbi:MAG: hypothetical protein Q8O37_04595 [Sulfuricellaceae bacterium]|nr:hypothetical protein [Sulfuricellaceae bacterium]